MSKIKIILPDKTEITSSFSYKTVPLETRAIEVLKTAFPGRYNTDVLVEKTMRWFISLGQDALTTFRELYDAKGIEFIPLLAGNGEGHIHFKNMVVIIDTIGDPLIPKLLVGLAIFTICSRLLAKHDFKTDNFLSTIDRQIVACITKEGYWNVDQLRDIWGILNYYFINVLGCHFEEID